MRREKAQEERRLRGICGESTVCVLVHYQALELGSLISKLKVTDQDTIFSFTLSVSWVSLVAQTVKSPPATQETWVRSLGWENPLEKEMATHSSIVAWRILWTEEPGGLQSVGSQRIGHD